MIVSKYNDGSIAGWRETYFSEREVVDVSVNGNITSITTRDRTTGRVESKLLFGKPPLPSVFEAASKKR